MTDTMKNFPALTDTQRQALLDFMGSHGALWRERLATAWEQGLGSPALASVETTHGLDWLALQKRFGFSRSSM